MQITALNCRAGEIHPLTQLGEGTNVQGTSEAPSPAENVCLWLQTEATDEEVYRIW